MFISIMSNNFRKSCCYSIALSVAIMSCSTSVSGEDKYFSSFLETMSVANGIQGCIDGNGIYSRGEVEGREFVYFYDKNMKLNTIGEYSFLGPIVCAGDSYYFTALNEKMNLYKIDLTDIKLIKEDVPCILSSYVEGDFYCDIDEAAGVYYFKKYDIHKNTTEDIFNTGDIGATEGIFYPSTRGIYGVFYRNGREMTLEIDVSNGQTIVRYEGNLLDEHNFLNHQGQK